MAFITGSLGSLSGSLRSLVYTTVGYDYSSGYYNSRMSGETKDDFRPFRHPFINGAQVPGGVGDTARTVSELKSFPYGNS